MQRFYVYLVLGCVLGLSTTSLHAEKPTPHESTHKQVHKLTPTHDGRPVELNTFAVDSEGNILACVTDSNSDSKVSRSLLQVYSPEGTLVRETRLPFNATAVNQAPSGIVFIAGDGQVGKVGADGKLLTTADAPHLGDREALRKQVEEDSKEQMKQVTEMYSSQVERVEEMMKVISEKEDATDRDKKRMASLKSQLEMFTKQQEMMETTYSEFYSVEAMMANAMSISSLAVNSKDVFLCCQTGRGYDVWRTDHDFSSPSKVVSGLSGCCGQCDIQADEENLVLAENTKFKVSLLDREGKRLTSFGSRAVESEDGFGSCCNPMNVRCCSNGDILTAESSIGTIKRYNKEGDFLGTVGKANIGGGCKHVAIGFDEKRDRYYMQYEDKDQICVMWPLSEAPEFTAEELEAKAAREGLGELLLGDGKSQSSEWSVAGTKTAAKTESGLLEALGAALVSVTADAAAVESKAGTETAPAVSDDVASEDDGRDVVEESEVEIGDLYNDVEPSANYFKFSSDGKLEVRGGYSEGANGGWAAVSQDLKTKTLIIAQLEEGIRYYNYKIKFTDDDTATFTMMYGDQSMSSQTFKRVPMAKK